MNHFILSILTKRIKRITLCVSIFFILGSSYAQDLCFINYNSRNGLPSSQVYDIFQDKNGDMWFATDRGIAKYDGFNFKVFDVSTGLPSNTIFDFFPQKDGTVWCSTNNNSWFYFKDGTENFQKSKFSDTLQKYSYNFQSDYLVIDKRGHVFIGFEGLSEYLEIDQNGKLLRKPIHGLFGKPDIQCIEMKIDGDFLYYIRQVFNSEHKYEAANVNYITSPYEKSGYRKAENINGYFVFSTGKTIYLKKDDQPQKGFDLGENIIGIGQYDTKHLWVGFNGDGIRIYDMNMQEKAHYLISNFVTDLFRDKHGGIWISTLFSGVYYAMNDGIEKINADREMYVYQIVQGDNHQIAIVDNNGLLHILKHDILKHDRLIQQEFVKPKNIKAFYDVRSKTFEHSIVSIGAYSNSYIISRAAIRDVTENSKTTKLFGSANQLILQKKNGGFSLYRITQKLSCSEFAKNGFYFGTNSGLYLLDTLKKKEIKLTQPDFQYRITDIKLIDGYHFIGTSGNGVLRYNEVTGKIDKVTTQDGLTNNIINELFAESKSCVWVATNNGLNKLTFKNGRCIIQTLTEENGLPNDEITDVIKVGNILWIGTTTGLLKMKASDVSFSNKNLNLNLFWENFKINSQKIAKSGLSNFSHNARNFKFNFHLSYFGGAKNVDIRYKLVGQDTKWSYTDQPTISFNYLNPGKYELIVQVRVENGNWSFNQLTLDFTVNPPFYATWWFISCSILLFGLLIYWFFKVRILIYNKDLVRELMRLILRKIKPKTNSFLIWSQGNEIRISSNDVLFFKAEGNYLEILTTDKKYIIRYKIGEINNLVPDKLEYIQVHRSYVVRLDKIIGKSLENIDVQGHIIPIGKTYKEVLKNLEI